MNKWQFCAIGTLLAFGLSGHWAGGQNPGGAGNDEAGLRKTVESYAAAINSGALPQILAFWTADAEFIDETGAAHKGKEAIGKLYQPSLADLKAGKVGGTIGTLRFLTPDVAVLDGSIEFTPKDGVTDSTRFSSTWVRQGGKWLIASARDLPDQDSDAADRCVKAFQWLAGDWTADDKGISVKLNAAPELGGKFMRMRYEIKGPKESMTVIQMLGWDPIDGGIRSWTFDSRGGFGQGLWMRDASVWAGETAGVLPTGQTASAVQIIRMTGPDSFVWQSTEREVEGQPIPDSEIKYSRVKK